MAIHQQTTFTVDGVEGVFETLQEAKKAEARQIISDLIDDNVQYEGTRTACRGFIEVHADVLWNLLGNYR